MRSLSVLIAAALLLLNEARAQTFERHYPLPSNTAIRGSSPTPDGGLVLCGEHDDAGYLMKLDAVGNVAWVRSTDVTGTYSSGTFGKHWVSDLRDVAALADGSLIEVGVGDTFSMANTNARKLVLMQDAVAATVRGTSTDIIIHPQEHNAIAMGAQAAWATGWNGHLGFIAASLHKLDPVSGLTLNVLDMCRSGTTSDLSGKAVAAMPDGGAVFGGYSYDGFIARVDEDLSILWTRTWEDLGVRSIAVSTDAIYLIGSGLFSGTEQMIIKVDLAGNEVWSKEVSLAGGSISSVIVRPDGNILLCGRATGSDPSGWAALLDPNGTQQWCKRYGNVGEVTALTGAENTAAGTRLIGTSGADLLVLAIDADGDLGPCAAPAVACTLIDRTLPAGVGLFPCGQALPPVGQVTAIGMQGLVSGDLVCADGGVWSASGTYFLDTDGDGTRDAEEIGLFGRHVVLDPEGTTAFTGADGAYSLASLLPGTHTVSAPPPPTFWGFTTPSSHAFTVAGGASSFPGLDFGITPLVDTTLIAASAVLGNGICASPVLLHVSIGNRGTTTPSGIMALTIDPLYTYENASPAPDSIVDGTIYWTYATLGLDSSRQWQVTLTSPAVEDIGAPYAHLLQVFADDGDGSVLVAQDSLIGTVECAYDPNDKSVSPQGFGVHGAIPLDTEWLTYTIRFQNTGTAPAQDVRVEDALSPSVQAASLEVLATSHPLTRVELSAGGIVRFHFDGIQLPDSAESLLDSQGYVRFRVRPMAGLRHLTRMSNTAHIFFDHAPAVVTNTVPTTFIDCAQAAWQPNTGYEPSEGLFASGYLFMDTMTYTVQWYRDGALLDGATGSPIQPEISGDYTAVITDEVGCSKTTAPVVVIVTGIVGTGSVRLGLRPNPVAGRARLVSSIALSPTTAIDLIDLTGKVVRRFAGNGSQEVVIDAGGLATGLYQVRISDREQVLGATRIVVE